MNTLFTRAADMLTAYAELVRRQGASELDSHYYIPEVESVCERLRELATETPKHEASNA